MGLVIPLNNVTRLDIPADRVLEQAIGKMDGVVILGYTKEGDDYYFASSYADGGTVMWLLERCKNALMNN
jgi:hypothetical protein